MAILDFLGGAILVLVGGLLAAVGGSGILGTLGYGAYGGFVAGIGGLAVILGIFSIIVGWGLWSGKSWAWMVALILYGIGALFSLFSLAIGSLSSIVSLAIYGLIIWYLMKPRVKAYFGQGTPTAGAQQAPAPQATG